MANTHWPSSGRFCEEIVGAQHHREAYEELTAWPRSVERSLFCIAHLRPEPGNRYDPNAVAIYCEDKKVGYLSKGSLDDFRATAEINGLLGKDTSANAKIKRSIYSDGRIHFSGLLDIDFNKPPAKAVRGKSNRITQTLVPIFSDVALIRDGHLLLICSELLAETVSMCTPGTEIDCWSPEGSEDVYLYAQGSVGGSCRVAITDLGFLRGVGFEDFDDFTPIVHSASGNTVIFCAKIPKTT